MSNWGLQTGGGADVALGFNDSTTLGLSLTAGDDTWGAWGELTASAPAGVTSFTLVVRSYSVAARTIVQVGIGAASSEVLIVENYSIPAIQYANAVQTQFFPIPIPEGVRVAVRAIASATNYPTVYIIGHRGGFLQPAPLSKAVALNANLSANMICGTWIDWGASADTFGSYVEIEDSTPEPYKGLIVCGANSSFISFSSIPTVFCLGVGSAGNEVEVLPRLHFYANGDRRGYLPGALGPFFVDIPAGSRLAVKGACGSDPAVDPELYILVMGLR